MNLRDIIIKHIKESKADGLCNPDLECGCREGDTMPCDEPNMTECVLGVMTEAPEGETGDYMIPLNEGD